MRPVLMLASVFLGSFIFASPASSGEAEIARAQSSIDAQLKAFLADDGAAPIPTRRRT